MSKQPEPRRTPRWAVAVVAVGAVLMVLAGGLLVAIEWAIARYEGAIEQRNLFGDLNEPRARYGEEIRGPLNILLAGLDTRPSRPHEVPRADAIMIIHVNESLDQAYMISLPRDLLVEIPPYPRTGFGGKVDRLNSAMAYGAQQLEGEELPDVARGFELLAATVSNLTGIQYFDAGAVINFEGFTKIVDAMGGITLEIEERIVSRHRQPDGRHRPVNPHGEGYLGPQMVYEPGVWELEGWMALDITRQRYGVEGSDYGRQQNQQKVMRAILDKALSKEIITDPIALDRVLRAAGESLIFDGRGRSPIDFAFALSGLRPSSLQMINLRGYSVGSGDNYRGEELGPEAYELFAAVAEGRLAEFTLANPQFLRAD